MQQLGPDPNKPIPNENNPSVCFIKNIIARPNIIVGDYTYYDDRICKHTPPAAQRGAVSLPEKCPPPATS